MKRNEDILIEYFKKLYIRYKKNDFVIDKSGVKIVELISPKIILDLKHPYLNFGVRKTPEKYVKEELNWYLSMDLSIEKIGKIASTWNLVAGKNKTVNSNYGYLIFSPENYSQYNHCLLELLDNKHSRRAVMVYQRPEIWEDYNENEKNDFICTDGVQCFIRKNKLIYIVKQRSCDIIYGFFNDFFWHCYVYDKLYQDLLSQYPNLKIGKIIYIPFSLHCYEKHFKLLESICTTYKKEK